MYRRRILLKVTELKKQTALRNKVMSHHFGELLSLEISRTPS